MKNVLAKSISIFYLSLAMLPSVASADQDDTWKLGISIYGWFPDISGQTSFPTGGGDFEIPVSNVLDNLQFTLQGSFDARKGRWGLFSDMIYLNLGKSDTVIGEGSIGGNDWPYDVSAHVGFDMKSLIWTNTGYYSVVDEADKALDFMAGLRYANIKQSLDWSFSGNIAELPLPGREGGASVKATYWDAIIGLKGQFGIGAQKTWFIPYYLDIGTGDSKFTYQVAAGVGYSFKWGQVAALWRQLSYDLPSDSPIDDMKFGGPQIGAVFRW